MVAKDELPDLTELSKDLGYDFEDDEPDLTHPESDSLEEMELPSFDEIEEELAVIRPNKKVSAQKEDVEYKMEEYSDEEEDLRDFDFGKYADTDEDDEDSNEVTEEPSANTEPTPEEFDYPEFDEGEREDFSLSSITSMLDESEPDSTDYDSETEDEEEEDLDISVLSSILAERTASVASEEEDTDDSNSSEDDEDEDFDEDEFLATLRSFATDGDEDEEDDEEEDDEDWRPDPNSGVPNVPVVPSRYTPLDEDDEEEDEEDDEYGSSYDGGNNFYYQDTPTFDDDDEVETPVASTTSVSPAEEEDDNPFAELNKSKKSDEDVESFKSRFKKKFQAFKAQAAAELRGEDAEEEDSNKEVAVVDKKEPKALPPGKEPGIFARLTAPFRRFYAAIAGFFYGIIVSILGFLGKLPGVGKYFLKLRDNHKLITVISNIIPVALLLALLIWLNLRAVPDTTSSSLPDIGSVQFSSFEYDEESNTASGVILNTGETIAQVRPTFSIYSMDLGFNPVTWVIPQKQFECVGDVLRIDIDTESKVSTKCEEVPDGFMFRVNGVAK